MNVKCLGYEWGFDEKTANLTCKRNGQPWRNETGDNAILALLDHACKLQKKIQDAENCLVCIACPSADVLEICNTVFQILQEN